MTPEQRARRRIDEQLVQAGWLVQDYRDLHISAGLEVAVREFSLKTGSADHRLHQIVDAWPTLSAEAQVCILALVRVAATPAAPPTRNSDG